jgi:hypothetical protein
VAVASTIGGSARMPLADNAMWFAPLLVTPALVTMRRSSAGVSTMNVRPVPTGASFALASARPVGRVGSSSDNPASEPRLRARRGGRS